MQAMGIIKIEVSVPELRDAISELAVKKRNFFETLSKEIKTAAASAVNQILNAEMTFFLGKSDQSDNKRNGYEVRSYAIKDVGALQIKVPVDRKRKFESTLIPKSEQIDPRLKEDLAVLHLAGLSTRTLAMISKRILGLEVSKQTVSNSMAAIEENALKWLNRELFDEYWALYIDGTHFKIQRRGSTETEPSLVVLGVNKKNIKSILAIEPGTKDNVDAWTAVFNELIKRGLKTESVRIGIMDGLPGLESLFKKTFTKSVTARCWVHAKKNAMAKVPQRLRDGFDLLVARVMYASSEDEARVAFRSLKQAMNTDAGRAVHCLEKDLEALMVHYRFDKKLWMALKTTNPIERVNKEFKRRSKSMGALGEKTLDCLLAFTALRLEMNWRKTPVDSSRLENLKYMRQEKNAIDSVMAELTH